MIRVLIADDQDLIRGALAALLNAEPDIEVVADCGSGHEVSALVDEHEVDVALLDIEMPGCPLEIPLPRCAVLIVTTFGRPGYLRRALAAGARGFVVKDTPAPELADAIRKVHAGLRVVDPHLLQQAMFDSPLTDREAQVCRAALTGADTRTIAADLHMSHGTVRNHLSSIITKTNAGNRFEAARIALDQGWI